MLLCSLPHKLQGQYCYVPQPITVFGQFLNCIQSWLYAKICWGPDCRQSKANQRAIQTDSSHWKEENKSSHMEKQPTAVGWIPVPWPYKVCEQDLSVCLKSQLPNRSDSWEITYSHLWARPIWCWSFHMKPSAHSSILVFCAGTFNSWHQSFWPLNPWCQESFRKSQSSVSKSSDLPLFFSEIHIRIYSPHRKEVKYLGMFGNTSHAWFSINNLCTVTNIP